MHLFSLTLLQIYPFDKFLLTYEDLALELLPVSSHP